MEASKKINKKRYDHDVLLGSSRINIYISIIMETIKISLNKNYDPIIWEEGNIGVV